MFTSTQFLTKTLNVDPEIATFFVDRRVPRENRYWKGRELFVAGGSGFLFIPLIYDILFRLGVDKSLLLDETHILRMEAVLDSAGKVEFDHYPMKAHVQDCMVLVRASVRNQWLWDSLQAYFIVSEGQPTAVLGEPVPPLNRADTFLFALCDLPMDETVTRVLIRQWYALVGSFLLLDDIMDWDMDLQAGEENTLRFLGEGEEAKLKAMDMLKAYFDTMESVNPGISTYLDGFLRKKMKTLYGIR